MFLADDIYDYEVLDAGDGMKLESWAGVILSRPDPQAIWERRRPELWKRAHAEYIRSKSGGGHWEYKKQLPEKWSIRWRELSFVVRPTGFKHTGLFPEQSANWAFCMERLKGVSGARVLNLFAYTGAATLACAAAGAEVTHVDAAKSMVAWAKENAAASGLSGAPIRYIIDDCLKFVLREQRRGRQYEGIIMDPPSYGRGADGQIWKVEEQLFNLVREAAKLLSPNARFFLISSYTTGLSGIVTGNMLRALLPFGQVDTGELAIPIKADGLLLPCGAASRWTRG